MKRASKETMEEEYSENVELEHKGREQGQLRVRVCA